MLNLFKELFPAISDFLLKLADGGVIKVTRKGETTETEKHENSFELNGKAFLLIQLFIVGIIVVIGLILRHFQV